MVSTAPGRRVNATAVEKWASVEIDPEAASGNGEVERCILGRQKIPPSVTSIAVAVLVLPSARLAVAWASGSIGPAGVIP